MCAALLSFLHLFRRLPHLVVLMIEVFTARPMLRPRAAIHRDLIHHYYGLHKNSLLPEVRILLHLGSQSLRINFCLYFLQLRLIMMRDQSIYSHRRRFALKWCFPKVFHKPQTKTWMFSGKKYLFYAGTMYGILWWIVCLIVFIITFLHQNCLLKEITTEYLGSI